MDSFLVYDNLGGAIFGILGSLVSGVIVGTIGGLLGVIWPGARLLARRG